MNRVEFINLLNCEDRLNSCFDEIMSIYDLCSVYNINNIKYDKKMDMLEFNISLPSINEVRKLSDILNNIRITNYNNIYNINLLLNNNNILNIRLIKVSG